MRSIVCVVAVVAVMFARATPARADDKTVCSNAYTEAQVLRDAHALLKTRAQLQVCARAECTWRAADCAKWLSEVEAAIPSIVFEAKDENGADVSAVKVSVDGAPLANRLDGTALSVDPGEHTFRFEAEGLPPVEKKLVIRESEKGRRERVVLGVVSTTAKTDHHALTQPATPPDEGASHTPTAAYVAFGVGGVGLVVGVVFTVLAVNANSGACPSAGCANDAETSSANNTVKQNSTAAGIGFGVAVLGAGIGTISILTSSSSGTARRAHDGGRLVVTPRVGLGWAGIDGRF